jgi:LacI family gluconate utilization system Gnt-I transcriptional repressor
MTLAAENRYAGPSSTPAGRDTLAALLEREGEAPDAVAFSNDDMAVGGFMHCLAAGIAVPERLALFGFNGLEIGQALPRPLSTILSNRFLIGKIAVETLLASPQRSSEPRIIDTGFSIIEGATA